MTWIESFPASDGTARARDPSYLFFLDVEGHADDPSPSSKAIDAVRKRCERLEILGSYPRGECVES